ncbi:chemotaxis protein CheW [Larsenimonas rhizosphaerae]|uniref:Chemotaxis protein CheW n=1 Tax=Larsenimonas rhizosphaerae TaxID=2944682 RepID=A0AA41ZDK4_9GAMM|nr:chemotaxis protein CheW [Larsenimonas rhizosphaerae]MCX2523329.1 chemotaxis protein CheW [Larsenimonas rhizosphaerae]
MSIRIFGILNLGATDVALSADNLLEVTTLAGPLAPRPRMPEWALGSFALRGALIPTIDLSRLLGFDSSQSAQQTSDQIAIVSYRGGRFGLRVHHVRDVVSIESSDLQELGGAQGATDALTPHVFIHPDEQRPIHVLDMDALFALEGMLLSFDNTAQRGPSEAESSAVAELPDRHRALIMECGDLRFAVDTVVVREVLNSHALKEPSTRLPGYLGNQQVRKDIIPVFDPRVLMGYKATPPHNHQLVVLDSPQGRIALAITRLERMADYTEDNCRLLTADDQQGIRHVRGLLAPPGLKDALLLDHRSLFDSEALTGLAAIHASLSAVDEYHQTAQEWQRFAFMSYGAGGDFVTPLTQIDAVLPIPETITPLSDSGLFIGTFRHLDRTVSMVDLRALLGRDTQSPADQILVVSCGDCAVGFMIDSVRRIEYIDAPRASLVVRWRGDMRANVAPIEASKRLVGVGEGARLKLLAVLCLASLANLLTGRHAIACDLGVTPATPPAV